MPETASIPGRVWFISPIAITIRSSNDGFNPIPPALPMARISINTAATAHCAIGISWAYLQAITTRRTTASMNISSITGGTKTNPEGLFFSSRGLLWRPSESFHRNESLSSRSRFYAGSWRAC